MHKNKSQKLFVKKIFASWPLICIGTTKSDMIFFLSTDLFVLILADSIIVNLISWARLH